ncbi:MAG TPA: hypothetical protein VK830_03595, partial [Xanthomonadales bacterium]|nr:hypothetical protein [Xanthomonadales bacterium]
TLTLLEEDVPNTIRDLLTKKEAEKLLDHLKQWGGSASSQWKARADKHQAAIDGGDPFEYAKVVKELSKMEAEGTLRPRDKAHLNQALDSLVEEVSRTLRKSPDQARKLIAGAVTG